MSNENIENAIVRITSKEYQDSIDETLSGDGVFGYTIGDELIDENHKDCFAKMVVFTDADGQTKINNYIKRGSDGSLFNPWGMFSEGTQGDYSRNKGKSEWAFSKVSAKSIGHYRWFLKTRNKAYLLNAEREAQ